MTVEKLITDHIDIWSSALQTRSTAGRGSNGKIDLYGIKKLRELILELAVRGKLVPQDPNDEPASELLKQIAKERNDLVKNKVIRKPKALEQIALANTPFDLPDGWEWCYLNDIGNWGAGATPSRSNSKYYNGEIPWFKSGELSSDFISDSEEKITELALQECSLRDNNVGDVLIAMYGATIGKTSILNVRGTTNQAVCACTPYSGISNVYLLTLLKAYKRIFIGMGAGGAQPNISRDKLIATVFALPPKAEQNRIICKVDELMSLCEQLEQQSLTSLDAHQQLVETLLATLTDSQNAEELTENWARISQYFDTLFTTEASIDAFKQTILQLAVMGKLVPQDPNDEPASELLKRIEQEKAQLVKEGKIKKQKPLPPVSDDEKPFELPEGWEWCRLGSLFNFQNGYAFKSEWFSDNGIRLVRNTNISHGNINWSDSVNIPMSMFSEFEGFSLNLGDVLISLDRPIINTGLKYAFVRECDLPCLLLQRVAKFNSVGNVIRSAFLSKWLESNYFINSIDPGRSNGVPHISTKQLEMTLFPLLSQREQDKIILFTDKLIQLCVDFKSRLQSAQQTQLHLADALTDAALN